MKYSVKKSKTIFSVLYYLVVPNQGFCDSLINASRAGEDGSVFCYIQWLLFVPWNGREKFLSLTNMLQKEVHKSQYILYHPTLCFGRNKFGIKLLFCANLLCVPIKRFVVDLFSIPVKAETSHFFSSLWPCLKQLMMLCRVLRFFIFCELWRLFPLVVLSV
jgi:hypothetical protein